MSDGSSIEWTDATWQVSYGCTRVSRGCDGCYAIAFAHRGLAAQHRGLTKVRPKDAARPGIDWNGEVRLAPENLGIPLRWRKPRRVFVNSMSDLFHERVPFHFIAAVFGVMATTVRHTYLVLTKRPDRAMEFFAWLDVRTEGQCSQRLVCTHEADRLSVYTPNVYDFNPWPLANVHLGVSAEDQATFDERVPLLLQCPAALHWVSLEPLLGPIDFGGHRSGAALGHVIIGGESGPRARAFDIGWARALVEQCRTANVPVFMKQLGARPVYRYGGPRGDAEVAELRLRDRKGKDPSEWPADLRVRTLP